MNPRKDLVASVICFAVALSALAIIACGCTTVYQSDKATIIKTHTLGLRITASQATSGATPEVDLGNVFAEIYILPTATNTLSIPRITDTSNSKTSWNPLSVGIDESLGFGDVSVNVGSTNGSGGSAVIPKTPFVK